MLGEMGTSYAERPFGFACVSAGQAVRVREICRQLGRLGGHDHTGRDDIDAVPSSHICMPPGAPMVVCGWGTEAAASHSGNSAKHRCQADRGRTITILGKAADERSHAMSFLARSFLARIGIPLTLLLAGLSATACTPVTVATSGGVFGL